MFVLVLNQSNLIQDGQNNKLVYRFPNSVNLTNKYIAVSSVSMYYSWFNITAAFGNNTFTYTWTSGANPPTVYTVIIPDGLYEITEINSYLQFQMVSNGTYWTDNTSNYYPVQLIINPTRYSIQLNTFLVPTSTQAAAAGLFIGSTVLGAPTFPTQVCNPIVTFPAAFASIVGYSAGFTSNANNDNAYIPPIPSNKSQNYVSKVSNGGNSTSTFLPIGTLSYLSDLSPNVQPNNSILFSLSNINNPYSQPSSIIYSIAPSVLVGEIIQDRPPNFMWNKLIDGTYNQLQLSILGTNLQPLIINDPNMTILLSIRDRDEAFLGSK
jgi:hypothetical protein